MRINKTYLDEMDRIPLLTLEEEKKLAEKSFKGDLAARNKLVEANLRFVIKVALGYKGLLPEDDLVNEGNIGLIHAAEKFDPSKNFRFTTYAVWWIVASIQKAIREKSTGFKFSAKDYPEMKADRFKLLSMDAPAGNNPDSASIKDFLIDTKYNPVEELEKKEAKEKVRKLVSMLPSREKLVLTKRFGLDNQDPMSLSEIGNLTGYSKEAVRLMIKKALEKMRKILEQEMYEFTDYSGSIDYIYAA